MYLAVKNNLIKVKDNSVIVQPEGHIYEPKQLKVKHCNIIVAISILKMFKNFHCSNIMWHL